MLTRLALQNIAIIESLELEFQPGLNAITGETGSGKSLMLDSIQRVFDRKGSPKELLRHGESRGRIELSFDLDRIHNRPQIEAMLEEAGIELEPGDFELIVSREITPSTSRCRVNGSPVSTEFMERLGMLVLEIFGQHDLHNLFSSARQRDILDNMGGDPLLGMRQEIRRAFREVQQLKSRMAELSQQKQDRERQLDFLSFQIQEITQAEISDLHEDEHLQAERERLGNSEHLKKMALQVSHIIRGDGDFEAQSIFKQLSQIQKSLGASMALDKRFSDWADQVAEAEEILKNVSQELTQYADNLEMRPERMNEIVDRLDLLEKLKRKYGGSLESVLKTATELEIQLDQLQQAEVHLVELETRLQQEEEHYIALCKSLSELRQRVAATLQESIQNELAALMLPAAEFAIFVEPSMPTETGQDQVTFMFTANPGEPLKPLSQVASGGELARLMLALKIRTAHANSLSTLILDEIDAGMSGVTVRAVAEKLQALQQQCQIIVITHQPIVAAKAMWHLHVQKHLLHDGVHVSAGPLIDRGERKAILSRLASGFAKDDAVTTQFVEQLLN